VNILVLAKTEELTEKTLHALRGKISDLYIVQWHVLATFLLSYFNNSKVREIGDFSHVLNGAKRVPLDLLFASDAASCCLCFRPDSLTGLRILMNLAIWPPRGFRHPCV
jgi:hypothetical protein